MRRRPPVFQRRKFSATVVGRDPKTDLAVIKIHASGDLPVATLGDSSKIRIGEWAMAIGSPFDSRTCGRGA